MKKIILTLIGMVAGASLVHAQGGLLSWANAAAHPSTNSTPYATGYPSTTGAAHSGFTSGTAAGLYYFVLLTATSTTANDAGNPFGTDWSAVSYASGGTALGTNNVVAGSVTGLGSTAGFASSLNAGTTYFDMVVAWSASLGADWATASSWGPGFGGTTPAGYFGYSNVGSITPTSAPANGAGIIAGGSANPGAIVLYAVPVPEPATIALAGLGGLAALALRRRKV
jgi:hypothetical protein